MKRHSLVAVAVVLSLGGACRRHAAAPVTVRIAAAADLRFALAELTAAFKDTHHDIDLEVSYGSSGSFFGQLLNRAPFDLFLSADLDYPRQLAERGLILPGTEFTYGVGRIVLWTLASSPIDATRGGMNTLTDSRVRHIAIANPEHAPYGRAAVSTLRSAGVCDRAASKLVFGENVSEALQVGIIAMSLALSPALENRGRFLEIPLESYPRIEQGGAIVSWTSHADAARQFRSFMMTAEARAVLKRYGFFGPGA